MLSFECPQLVCSQVIFWRKTNSFFRSSLCEEGLGGSPHGRPFCRVLAELPLLLPSCQCLVAMTTSSGLESRLQGRHVDGPHALPDAVCGTQSFCIVSHETSVCVRHLLF